MACIAEQGHAAGFPAVQGRPHIKSGLQRCLAFGKHLPRFGMITGESRTQIFDFGFRRPGFAADLGLFLGGKNKKFAATVDRGCHQLAFKCRSPPFDEGLVFVISKTRGRQDISVGDHTGVGEVGGFEQKLPHGRVNAVGGDKPIEASPCAIFQVDGDSMCRLIDRDQS